ncbi:MAG TPA: phage tail protein [Dissulfurispiraceae bacterium]|nr:phage tail protein [Dissulfurispiraceae bacterium]
MFGTVLVKGCQYIYGGAVRTAEIKVKSKGGKGKGGKDQIVGYAWFASFAMSTGGAVDAVLELHRDGKKVWTGNVTTNGTTIQAQTGQAYEPGGSGTGPSNIIIYLGTQTTADATMAAWTGYNVSYKGKTLLVFNDVFVGDGVSNAPAFDVVLKRTNLIPNGTGGYNDWSTYSAINVSGTYADCNPAHALLYILTRMLKVDAGMIDLASFRTAGITLFNEGLGCSFQMDAAQQGEHWIQEILRTIDAAVWHDLVSNTTKIQLFRNDYVVGSLVTLTDSNIKKLEFERQAWEDFPTEVTIKYTDRSAFKSAGFTIPNPASRKMLGYSKPEEYSFMIISNLTAMQGVKSRLAKKLYYPLLVMRFSVSRSAFPSLAVGQCVRVNSAAFGFSNLVVRITNMGSDSFADQEVEIEAMQDPYGLAELDITPGSYSMATDYDWSVGAIAQARVIDAPAEVVNVSAVMVMYTPPGGTPMGVKHFLSDVYQMTGSARVFGYGVLNATLSGTGVVQHANVIQNGVGFYINSGAINVVEVAATRAAFQRLKFTLIMGSPASGWEIIGYQNCTLQGDGRYYIDTLMRGLNNTTIRTHNIGEEVWFFWADANEMPALPVDPASINIDLCGFNQRGVGSEKALGAYTYGYTQEKPYPVSNLKGSRVGNDITLQWVPCKRLGLTGYRNPANFAAGDDTPEGSWQVRWNDGTEHIVDVTGTTPVISYGRTDAGSRTYYVRSVLNGYVSAERSIVI